MNIRQLETFYWIAQLGTFSAAAERLHTSQANVSARIRELEEELGLALFDRIGRQVQLTVKARELLGYAERVVNEAARCLEEGIVTEPSDVDFAMIMGTGFAPFRGGPLRYADGLGGSRVIGEMKRLADSGAGHFEPCALLQTMAAEGKKFCPQKGDRR